MNLKTAFIAAAAAAMMCVPCLAGDITVNVDGKNVDFPNQQPVIQEGRTLIPLRGVFDTLGYEVTWAGDTKTVTLSKDNTLLIIVIGQKSYFLNGVSHDIDVPAQIINGSTMLPLRAVGEAAGLSVAWDGEKKTAILISGEWNEKNTENYVVSYDEEDGNFLSEYQTINEGFDKDVEAFNVCMQWVKSEGLHSEEDYIKLADAAQALKKSADDAVNRLVPRECSERMGKLKNSYIAFVRSCGDNADVIYKFVKGEITADEYAAAINDSVANMVSAEAEYKTAFTEVSDSE